MFDFNQPDPSAKIAELERRIAALELGPTDIQVQNKSFTANEGQHCIVECPPAGITATLPRARAQNRNARITFTLRNSNPVRFIAVNGKVNNRTSGVMASPGTFDAISDGSTGWGISVLAAGPSAVPTLNADFVVGVANPGLPNARVATASVEITPSIAVANAISWALNAGSVVLSRLQNLTGLSVLGRAANSAGVMAAITAGGAAQYLRSNSGGTSLEFGDPASASIINTAGTFVTAAITGAVTIAQNGTVAAFGTLAAKSVLANATNATAVPSALSGSASFQHLRVNAANNALEWSVLTTGDFGPASVPITALTTIGADTVLSNITAGAAAPAANLLANFAGAGLGFSAHAFVVNVGPSLAIVTDNVVREALSGAITAAQDSNVTAFGVLGAKSVLANATNASAVPAALAGTAAFQHLRVNSANTGLEWAVLTVAAPITLTSDTIGFDQTAALGNNARVAVAKNSGATVGARRQLNLIEGTNITITEADDSANERVNVTIAASGSSLPSIAADSFLGNIGTVSATAAQVLLSAIDSASVAYDATTHAFQRAALTGAITAAQDSNATVFKSVASDTFIGNISASPAAADSTSLASIASTSIPYNAAHQFQRAALTGAITSAQNSNATAFGSQINGTVLGNGSGSTAPVVPVTVTAPAVITATTLEVNLSNDRNIVTGDGGSFPTVNAVGFRKSASRTMIWDDFFGISNGALSAAGFINTVENAWTLDSVVGTVNWASSALSGHPGTMTFSTGAVSGNRGQLEMTQAGTIFWSDIEFYEACFSISSQTSSEYYFGWQGKSVLSYAYFHFTTAGTVICESSDATTPQTTTITATPTTMAVYSIRVTGSTIQFYVGGVLKATHSTHVPGGTNTGQFFFYFATATTAARAITIDYFSMQSTNLARAN